MNKGTQPAPRNTAVYGLHNGKTKLSPETIAAMRARVAEAHNTGETKKQIAAEFGVSATTLNYHVKGLVSLGARYRANRDSSTRNADQLTARIRAIAARQMCQPEPRRIVAAMCGDVARAERARKRGMA